MELNKEGFKLMVFYVEQKWQERKGLYYKDDIKG